jgi:hypothetical protein
LTVKLHINISQGLIEVEGDADLVREIYADYRDQLLNGERVAAVSAPPKQGAATEANDSANPRPKSRRRGAAKRRASGEDQGPTINADQPKLDKNLDTSGLPAFYGQFEARNNAEKILIFLKFMNDELAIVPPNTDQFYTCFEKVNERVPRAFSQAFRDASGRKFGYIDYDSPTDIRLTTTGNNYFKFDLKRKATE